jgi:hypothetical protein
MPRKLSRVGRLAALGMCAALMAPSGAAAAVSPSCTSPETTQAFSAFGDTGNYYLAPGGSFEGALSWTRVGREGSAEIVDGNSPFLLNAATDRSSLRLRGDGTVRSPKMCVSRDMPHLRFVARAKGSGGLAVTVNVYDSTGKVTDSSSGSLSESDHRSWAPADIVDLKTEKFARGQWGYVDVQLMGAGDWLVDDLFIDPYKR